jgi:hypothetical protein
MSHKKYNWKQIYKDFLKTDMTPSAYARTHGLPSSCIYPQFKKLGYVPEETSTQSSMVDTVEPVDIVPIQVIHSEPKIKTAASISVTICGATIHLENGFDKRLFKETVEVLKELC